MIDFTHIEQSVKELKTQLAHHKIDEKNFEDQLLALIDIAEDGYYWMFGHESEQWFRHNGETWLPDDPHSIISRRAKKSTNPAPVLTNPSSVAVASVNWGWFIISMIVLTVIGSVVYSSSLF
jgi:hypothetical protein